MRMKPLLSVRTPLDGAQAVRGTPPMQRNSAETGIVSGAESARLDRHRAEPARLLVHLASPGCGACTSIISFASTRSTR